MEDLFKHLETLGISFGKSPAANEYSQATTEDELHYSAGQHLAAHATAIVEALKLPGSDEPERTSNSAFCLSALIDLCAVRAILKEHRRWPELSQLLDRILVMACAHRSQALGFSEDERNRFYDQATDHLMDFQDDDARTYQDQIDRLMNLEGLSKERIDRPAFIRAAFVDPSWIDPWVVISHHDRLTRSPR